MKSTQSWRGETNVEAKQIRQSVHALLQEIAHWHMVSGNAGTLGDIQQRLESHYPITNEENISSVSLHVSDFIGFMSGNYDPTIAVASVSIQDKINIMAISDHTVEVKLILKDGDTYQIYDYERLINDVHKALGTGRKLDLGSYDLAAIVRDMDREK